MVMDYAGSGLLRNVMQYSSDKAGDIRFNLADPSLHYHLPLKITPWGFSIYRGA